VSCRASSFTALAPLIALLLSGCSGPDLDIDRSMPTPPTPAPAAECAVMAEQPGLAAWELNEALPIAGVDMAGHQQREVLLEAGGPCTGGPAEATLDECRLVAGPYEQMSDTILWREAHPFAEQEIAAGAQRVLFEEMVGYTVDDESFHWRAVAVAYLDPAEARVSPAWEVINSCDLLQHDDRLGDDVVSLSQGDEPFLAAKIDGSTLYIVETWVATDRGDPTPLDDTETGLPPARAVSMIMEWIVEQSDAL
jgi:hypothetical protein